MARGIYFLMLSILLLLPMVYFHETSIQPQPTFDDKLDAVDTSEDVNDFLQLGQLPEGASGRLLVFTKSSSSYTGELFPPIKIGGSYFHIIDAASSVTVQSILYDDPRAKIIFDRYMFSTPDLPISGALEPESFVAKSLLGIEEVWNQYGYDGKGVTIGITDSGVDFGVTDLIDSPKLLSNGLTASFDPTGTGISPTSLEVSPVIDQGQTVLPIKGHNLTVSLGEEGGVTTSDQLGLELENLEITNLLVKSVSNKYKVGMMYQPGEVRQVFIYVLVDSQVAGVYDTIFVDLDTSLGLSLALNGIIFEVGRLYRSLVDWSLSDESPFGNFDPIIARDINLDGIIDVSMGALATGIDWNGLVNADYVRGIDPQGRGISVMYDAIGHGTQVSSAAAGRGITPIQIYDNFTTTDTIENNTVYYLPGSAPNASLIATKGLQLSDFILGWFWTAGLEIILTGDGGFTVNEEHRADISSNSWGQGLIGENLRGMDAISLLTDALSTPNIFSTVDFDVTYPSYPGLIFFIAAGNGGPGYGTVTIPATSVMAISIGASTSFHPEQNQGKNDVALFSGTGPTPLGYVKPDLVALGSFGFTNKVVISGRGNGTYAAGIFGGTSEATPRAAGIGALLIQALKDNNIAPTLSEVKSRLKSAAHDLGFPAFMQGAGLVNAFYAVSTVFDANYLLVKDTESLQLIGSKLNSAFQETFEANHPLLTGNFYDSAVHGYPNDFQNGRKLTIQRSNGSSISGSSVSIVRFTPSATVNTSFTTSLTANGRYALNSLEPLLDSDFILISIGLTESSYNALVTAGLSIRSLELIDRDTGRIVEESFSSGYSQQIYSGNPSLDFESVPTIVFEDPGFAAQVPLWPGLTFEVTAIAFERQQWNEIGLFVNGSEFTLNISSLLSNVYQQGFLELNQPFGKVYLPLTILNSYDVKIGSAAENIGDENSILTPMPMNASFGAFNWVGSTARPEAGDSRFYELSVPSNATYLAVNLKWNKDGMLPNLYLFDSKGILISKSQSEYIGGGFYQVTTSEKFAQNLLVEAEDTVYYLMVHFVGTPFGAGPYGFNLLVRYLNLTSIPKPIEIFSQPIDEAISKKLVINSSQYSVDQFPELKILETSTMVFKGQNHSFNDVIDSSDIELGTFTPEKEYRFNFTQGEKGIVNLTWDNTNVDVDMYLVKSGFVIKPEDDLFRLQGTIPTPKNESAFFSIPESGEYSLYIDVVNSSSLTTDLLFEVHLETRQGPTFTNEGAVLELDTALFENGNFGLWITYQTNFAISFENIYNVEFVNHQNFTSSMVSPIENAVLSGLVNVNWSASVPVVGFVYLKGPGVTSLYFLGSSNSNHLGFDSTVFKNGDYMLIVELTDGIYRHVYQISISLNNKILSTLSINTSTTSDNRIPLLLVGFVVALVTLINRRKRRLKFQN